MILTEHVKMRYAQRISGIENEEDALQYAMDNEVQVSYDLWTMANNSMLLFENYTYDVEKDATGNIRLYKDIIIVTSNNPPFKMITLWKSETAYTGRLETQEFIKELNVNRHQLDSIKKKFTRMNRDKKYIESTMEKLNDQYEMLELERINLETEFDILHGERKEIKNINRRIVRYLAHGFKL